MNKRVYKTPTNGNIPENETQEKRQLYRILSAAGDSTN